MVGEYTCRCWEILQKQADVIPLTNKATLDHHFRAFPKKVRKKRLSVQVVRLSVKVCCLHLYTIIVSIIKLILFSYISAKFEAAVWFYKITGAHQRRQVEEKWLPLSTDQLWRGCLWWQVRNFSGYWWQVIILESYFNQHISSAFAESINHSTRFFRLILKRFVCT